MMHVKSKNKVKMQWGSNMFSSIYIIFHDDTFNLLTCYSDIFHHTQKTTSIGITKIVVMKINRNRSNK